MKIRPFYVDKDMKDVCNLYGVVFGPDSLESWQRRWRWEYLESPWAGYAVSRSWVAEQKDKAIVGLITSFPMRLKIGAQEVSKNEPGDLAVHPDARRQGLGQALINAYMENEKHIIIAHNYAAATGRIVRRIGLIPVYCVPWYYRLNDLWLIFRFLIDTGRLPTWARKKPLVFLFVFGCKILNSALALLNKMKTPLESPKYTIAEVEKVGDEFDKLWMDVSPQFPIVFVRDAKFIKWRFIDDPNNKHMLLAAHDEDGTLRGYIAIIISTVGVTIVGRIMDIFCAPDNIELVDSLLAKAIKHFKQRGAAYLTCMGLHPLIRKRVQRYLYYRPQKKNQPVFIKWKANPKLKFFVINSENWHLSHADGDLMFFDYNISKR